jgi:hypothetical protein
MLPPIRDRVQGGLSGFAEHQGDVQNRGDIIGLFGELCQHLFGIGSLIHGVQASAKDVR